MKLSLKKLKEQYKLLIENDEGKQEKFDYIKFINMLYDGESVENIEYDDNISQEEKEQINKMIEEIKEIVRGEK